MLIARITEHLRSVLETKSVFGAAEFYHALEQTGYTESPSYFVIPNSEQSAGANDDDIFFINNQVRIVVMVDLKCDDFQAKGGIFDATQERSNLFKALLAWQPECNFRPTTYVNGALLKSDGRRLFYAYTFNFPEQVDPACEGYDAAAGTPADIRLIAPNC